MSSFNANTNQRKRSRWGDSSNNNNKTLVSDQEALDALVASASSKQEQQQPHRNHDNKRPRRPDDQPGGVGSRNGSGQDYSYYGRNRDDDNNGGQSSYGSSSSSSHAAKTKKQNEEEQDDNEAVVEKEKPNFGLSGALAQEQQQEKLGGRGGAGVGDGGTELLKFREPPEARAPNTQWRLYVFKGEKALETLHLSKQSAYLLGRNQELVDIPLLHPSSSGQHAVLQYRAVPANNTKGSNTKEGAGGVSTAGSVGQLRVKPYLMDLDSTNGSFINGVRLDPRRYYELRKGDVLKFGASTREYVLLTENTTSIK